MARLNIPAAYKGFNSPPDVSISEVEKHAKADGNLGISVDKHNLPKVMLSITQTLHKYQQTLKLTAQKYFAESQAKILNYLHISDTHQIKTDIENIVKHPKDLHFDDEETSLEHKFKTFNINKDNYINFKRLNGLSLMPVNADPDHNGTQKLILYIIIVGELILNAFMMYSGGAIELFGALAISVAQTAINIGFCYLGGKMLIGQIKHADSTSKRIGYGIVFLFHVYLILLINANMGLYRDAIVQSTQSAALTSVQVIGHWSWSPWEKITEIDVTAVLMIFVGVLFALIAYIDGYFSDDPYPGYGATYRTALKQRKLIQSQIKSINQRWYKVIAEAKNKEKDIRDLGLKAIKEWSHEINVIEQVRDDYKDIVIGLEKNFEQAMKMYVSTYNKFSKETKKLALTNIILLEKREFDMNIIFSDTKHFFYNDNDRLRKEKLMKEDFIRKLDKILKEMHVVVDKQSQKIKKLSETFACHLN